MIIHFKRQKGKPLMDSDYDGTVDGLIAESRGSLKTALPFQDPKIFLKIFFRRLSKDGTEFIGSTNLQHILFARLRMGRSCFVRIGFILVDFLV